MNKIKRKQTYDSGAIKAIAVTRERNIVVFFDARRSAREVWHEQKWLHLQSAFVDWTVRITACEAEMVAGA